MLQKSIGSTWVQDVQARRGAIRRQWIDPLQPFRRFAQFIRRSLVIGFVVSRAEETRYIFPGGIRQVCLHVPLLVNLAALDEGVFAEV